ncbi:unnamed protein product, partial [Tilletia controversa]
MRQQLLTQALSAPHALVLGRSVCVPGATVRASAQGRRQTQASSSPSRPFASAATRWQSMSASASAGAITSDASSPLNADLPARSGRSTPTPTEALRPPPSSSSPALRDRHGRDHSYLRISLTERCNLRCLYCMPEEGIPLTPSEKLLSQAEIGRLARLFVREGVTKVRLTGGEPTLRSDLVGIVESLNDLRPLGLRQIGLTSNGISLHRKLPALVSSGLTHLNLSLDTLDPFKFEFMTRRRGFEAVIRSLDKALELGMESVKLNVVVLKGLNDGQDVLDFVQFTRDKPVTVRFIEYMPFDGNKWQMGKLVPYRDLLDRIQHKFGPLERLRDDDNDTSKGWRVPGFAGSVGFITSMTEHFCGTCNRLRITADGNLKVCLFGNAEISLRDAMRGVASTSSTSTSSSTSASDILPRVTPATDDQLLDVISAAVGRKHARHAGMSSLDALAQGVNRPMVAIEGLRSSVQWRQPSTQRRAIPTHLLGSSSSPALDAPSSIRHFSSTASPKRGGKGGRPGDDAGEDDDLSDLDFSYEPHFERLGGAPGTASTSNPTSSSSSSLNTSSQPEPAHEASHGTAAVSQPVVTRPRLTHVDPSDQFRARMVDVSGKASTVRTGVAVGRVYLSQLAMALIRASEDGTGGGHKGPVLRTAQLAGIMGAKRTAELIPLCHPLSLSHVDVVLELVDLDADEDEGKEREAEELAALASSEAFVRQATAGGQNEEAEAGGGRAAFAPGGQQDFGFRIEDLMDGDRWRGKEFDMNDAGVGGGGEYGGGNGTFSNELRTSIQARAPFATSSQPHAERKVNQATTASTAASTDAAGYVQVTCTARTTGPTGVEMEALVGANVACLTVWDMVKAVAGQSMW